MTTVFCAAPCDTELLTTQMSADPPFGSITNVPAVQTSTATACDSNVNAHVSCGGGDEFFELTDVSCNYTVIDRDPAKWPEKINGSSRTNLIKRGPPPMTSVHHHI